MAVRRSSTPTREFWPRFPSTRGLARWLGTVSTAGRGPLSHPPGSEPQGFCASRHLTTNAANADAATGEVWTRRDESQRRVECRAAARYAPRSLRVSRQRQGNDRQGRCGNTSRQSPARWQAERSRSRCHRIFAELLTAISNRSACWATMAEITRSPHQAGSPTGRARAMIILCRSAGIPARLVTGFEIKKADPAQPRTWVEAYINDRWEPFDLEDGHERELPYNFVAVLHEGLDPVRITNSDRSSPTPI